MLWRFLCRHRHNILLSLIWWYWSRSLAQTYTICLILHVQWEISLWYKIGKVCSHTYGKKNVRAWSRKTPPQCNNTLRHENENELLCASDAAREPRLAITNAPAAEHNNTTNNCYLPKEFSERREQTFQTHHLQRIIFLAMALSWRIQREEEMKMKEFGIALSAATAIQAKAWVWMQQ